MQPPFAQRCFCFHLAPSGLLGAGADCVLGFGPGNLRFHSSTGLLFLRFVECFWRDVLGQELSPLPCWYLIPLQILGSAHQKSAECIPLLALPGP